MVQRRISQDRNCSHTSKSLTQTSPLIFTLNDAAMRINSTTVGFKIKEAETDKDTEFYTHTHTHGDATNLPSGSFTPDYLSVWEGVGFWRQVIKQGLDGGWSRPPRFILNIQVTVRSHH